MSDSADKAGIHELTVLDVVEQTADACSISFAIPDDAAEAFEYRPGQFLTLGAKARALLQGRLIPDLADVRTLADAVLRHRIVLNYEAEAARVGVGDVIGELVAAVDRDAG